MFIHQCRYRTADAAAVARLHRRGPSDGRAPRRRHTAVFSIVEGVLLRPVPYGDLDQLVRLSEVPRRAPTLSAITSRSPASRTSIDFVDFGTARRTTLATIGKRWSFGIALSPDERWLLFPVTDREGRDLMLVDYVR
jgi:hypothetical protein